MNKKTIIKSLVGSAVGTAGAIALKNKAKEFLSSEENKRMLMDKGDIIAHAIVQKLADKISDRGIPYLNRYDNEGYLEGSGYFLAEPKKNAKWSVGFAKASIIPEKWDGDLYIGGYLAFPPNKANGILNDQLIRAVAFDDNSGRGINVFAVIDCIGISNADIRTIRSRLKGLINDKNIVSINISATHCHSGVDTQGIWGDLIKAVKTNPKAIKRGRPEDVVSGKNPDFMEHLFKTAAATIEKAVLSMKPGKLSFATLDGSMFVRDKRAPYITDNTLLSLKFEPKDKSKTVQAVFLAAHPVCYGSHQREISSDFPYYICEEFEKNGYEAMFFQGAEAAIATNRGYNMPEGLTWMEGIAEYGRSIARFVLDSDSALYKEIEPMLNVKVDEILLPSGNSVLELAGKLRLVNNNMTRVAGDGDDYDLYFASELGYAEFGKELKLVMVPGEMIPEILTGGASDSSVSYNGTDWKFPAMRDIVNGHLSVIGLCNDSIGYIVPDNDFGSVFAPEHYEEAVSAGGKTASNIMSAFIRLVDAAEKIRY